MDAITILDGVKNEIEQMRGQKNVLVDMKSEVTDTLDYLSHDLLLIEEGQKLVQDVALATQSKLKMSIEPIVTSALDIVFKEEAYEFVVDFEVKRGKTECSLLFQRDGHKFVPMRDSGFGAVDVASFALRLALWNISRPHTNPIFFLDEPFSHVSEDLQESVIEMVRVLSDKLGIQVIIVSHNKEADLMAFSNKVFFVRKDNNGVSTVKVTKG